MAWEHTTEVRCDLDGDRDLPDTPMNTNIINCSGLQAHKLSATHLLASPEDNRNPLNDSTGKTHTKHKKSVACLTFCFFLFFEVDCVVFWQNVQLFLLLLCV